MFLLHASFDREGFYLWGEVPATAAPPAGHFPFEAKPEMFPKAELLGFKPKKSAFVHRLLWSPVKGKEVLASSPLIASPSVSKGKERLAPHRLKVLPLASEEAIELFTRVTGKHMLAPGVVVAPDLAFCAETYHLARMISRNQQFLPGLVQEDSGWFARWVPRLAGDLPELLSQAASSMPASLRAMTPENARAAPTTPSLQVVTTMLAHWVDTFPRKREARRPPVFHSIHDQWLFALQSPTGEMTASFASVAELATAVSGWRRPLDLTTQAPLRLCFRLEEPKIHEESEPDASAPSGDWFVRYFLQPHDDPSMFIGADQVWSGQTLPNLNLEKAGCREMLLSLLGLAASFCSGVASSLEDKAPAGFPLDIHGAHAFLSADAAQLRQFGFRVLLPTWWTRQGARAHLAVKARASAPSFQASSNLNLNTVIQFRPELALDGEVLTERELALLAELKAPLVRLRGQWVEMGDDQLRKALSFLQQKQEQQLTLGELIRLKIGAQTLDVGLPLDQIVADGWLEEVLARLDRCEYLEPYPAPASFAGTLRPYQQRGFSWLRFLTRWGLGACLADDMGLGKTVQTLAHLSQDFEAGNSLPVLLVCPVSVVDNWRKEAEKFTPDLTVFVHHGPTRCKGKEFRIAASKAALTLTSYGLLQRDHRLLAEIAWRGVILDEAQHIKNAATKLAAAARTLDCQYRIALSGTPVENNVGDLWSIMDFLNPGLLGNQASFKRQFFNPIQGKGDAEAAEKLKGLTGPFILRRLKTDQSIINDLPEKIELKTYCPLTREQTSLYAAVLKDLQDRLEAAEGIERRGLILALLTALKQVCNHPSQFLADGSTLALRSGKFLRLEEILEEVFAAQESALLFTQYAEMGFLLQRHLQEIFGRETPFLHGGVPKASRDLMVARFQQAGPELPLLILSLKAGGTGLNLTRANHVIHFDRWWNPAVEDQATDRAFRIGQKRAVTVHKFICGGTVEDKIDEMIDAKRKVAGAVVGSGEAMLTELSNEELRDVFALRATAMED